MVSFLSAITLLGTPIEIYTYGTMYVYLGISWIIASTITAFVFMPKFRQMNFTSAYQVFCFCSQIRNDFILFIISI